MGFDVDAYYPDEGSAISTKGAIETSFGSRQSGDQDDAPGYLGHISNHKTQDGFVTGSLEGFANDIRRR